MQKREKGLYRNAFAARPGKPFIFSSLDEMETPAILREAMQKCATASTFQPVGN